MKEIVSVVAAKTYRTVSSVFNVLSQALILSSLSSLVCYSGGQRVGSKIIRAEIYCIKLNPNQYG